MECPSFNPLSLGARPDTPAVFRQTSRWSGFNPLSLGARPDTRQGVAVFDGAGGVSIPSLSGHGLTPNVEPGEAIKGSQGFNPLSLGARPDTRGKRSPRGYNADLVSIPSLSGHGLTRSRIARSGSRILRVSIPSLSGHGLTQEQSTLSSRSRNTSFNPLSLGARPDTGQL